MEKRVDVAIIGAGSAGLSAFREVQRITKSFVVINGGHYGTTCARVGCMPSKVLIQIANDFHRRKVFERHGIRGGGSLSLDAKAALRHVRALRDRFVKGVMGTVEELGDHNVRGYARFVEPGVLRLDDGSIIRAKKIIVANGSRPIVPKAWEAFRDRILTSDEIFEIEDLPGSLAVVGLGVIGLELGQAMHRLGVTVSGFGRSRWIGGLSDPEVNAYAVEKLHPELDFVQGAEATVKADPSGKLEVTGGSKAVLVEKVLASLGRRPNLDNLDFHNSGAKLDAAGLPTFNPNTMQVENLPLFIAGDISAYRPILHEAADEGRIAGYNAVRDSATCFRRRTRLGITFSDPNIAFAGERFEFLPEGRYKIGEVRFDGQGRSLVMGKNVGLLRVYGDPRTGKLIGAEMMAPSGEHLAHLLAWAIQRNLTVWEALQMPFYHPVVEEGLRTALRHLADQTETGAKTPELPLCDPSGVESLS